MKLVHILDENLNIKKKTVNGTGNRINKQIQMIFFTERKCVHSA